MPVRAATRRERRQLAVKRVLLNAADPVDLDTIVETVTREHLNLVAVADPHEAIRVALRDLRRAGEVRPAGGGCWELACGPSRLTNAQAQLLRIMRAGVRDGGQSAAATMSTWAQAHLDRVDGALIEVDLHALKARGAVEQVTDDGRELWRATVNADWLLARHAATG